MKRYFAALAFFLAFAGAAFSQDTTATLVGRVTDPSHAVVPNATVTVTELGSNAIRTAKTNRQGEYTVSDLQPGSYAVVVAAAGFKDVEEPSVTMQTAQTARFDVVMTIGSASETVTVTTEVGALNTETSDKGDVITPVEISEMPLNGRDFNDLVFNVAGVSTSEEGTKGAEFVANGVRADQSNVLVDGVNNTNPRDSSAAATPPLDALGEFKVQTSNYSAEFGRVAGPVINLQIKKGTNRLRGSVFEFVRNDMFDAANYFDVPGVKSELRRNQFGGTIGGPVYIPHIYNGHNKTFFMVSEESYRQVQGSPVIGIVPTELERNGDFSKSFNSSTGQPFTAAEVAALQNPATATALTAGVLPKSAWDPTAVALLNQFYPHPTLQYALPPGNNYITDQKGYTYWDNILTKVDQQIAAHDEGSVKFQYKRTNTIDPFGGSDTGLWGSHQSKSEMIVAVDETHIFTASLINNFRSGLTRQTSHEHALDAGVNWSSALGMVGLTSDPALEQFPTLKVTGFESLGDSTQSPIDYIENNYDTNDTVTWSKGKHTVKLGGDMLRAQYFQPTNSEFSGSISYSGNTALAQNAFLEFLAGAPTSADVRQGTVTNHLYNQNYSGYLQDDYKALAGLTLNLGLRYEYEQFPTEEAGQYSSYSPALKKLVLAASETPALDSIINSLPASTTGAKPSDNIVYASSVGYPHSLIFPNLARIAPRVGFALRPFVNDKLVVRGGYGIFYAGTRLTVLRTELAGQTPFSIVDSCSPISPSTVQGVSTLNTVFQQCNARFSTANGYDPHAPSAYIQSYNLTVERELPKGMAVELAYVGSKGTHLMRQIDINQENVAYGAGTFKGSRYAWPRPLPFFNGIKEFDLNAYSHYDAGEVTLRKRFEHGLLFRLNFTWSKALDLASGANYAGNGGFAGAQNTLNPNAEYSRADSDREFVLNGNFVYVMPFRHHFLTKDWQTAGSIQADSGLPFTPQLNGPSLDGGYATRPNRVCSGKLAHPTVNRYFDTSCFQQVVESLAQPFGNSGRNILTGPNLFLLNLSVSRNFPIKDRQKLQFRWEVFNVVNHPNFYLPNDYLDEGNVGSITKARDPRVMQLGAKYEF